MIIAAAIIRAPPTLAATDRQPQLPGVWFAPAIFSPDYLNLFTESASWNHARGQVNAFLFSPEQVDGSVLGGPNALSALTRIDAFRKLKGWGIATAIGVPAVKEWDCTGRKAAAITKQIVANVVAAGGKVQILSLDEPLFAGRERNKPFCDLRVAD